MGTEPSCAVMSADCSTSRAESPGKPGAQQVECKIETLLAIGRGDASLPSCPDVESIERERFVRGGVRG